MLWTSLYAIQHTSTVSRQNNINFSLEMMLEPWAAYRSCIAGTKNKNLKHCKITNFLEVFSLDNKVSQLQYLLGTRERVCNGKSQSPM